MGLTLGTPYTNVDGVDDPTTNSFFLCELPGISDKAVAFYTVNDTSNYKVHARVVNTSGTTISTIGVEQTLHTSSGGSDIIDDVWAEAQSSTRVLVTWKQRPSAYEFKIAIATISGDTVTIGSVQTLDSSVHASEPVYASWVNSSLIIGIFMGSALSDFYCVAATVSGSTISSPGTRVLIDTSMGTTPFNVYQVKGSGDGSRSLIVWNDVANTQARIAKITSGTTISLHTINSFLATTSMTGLFLTKVPDDNTTFIATWGRGINILPEAVHLTIVPGSDTVTDGAVESWHSADADNSSGYLTMLTATLGIVSWSDGIGTNEGMVSEMSVSGTTLTVDEADDIALAAYPASYIVKVGVNRALCFYNDVDAVIVTTDEITTNTHLWLRNATPVWNNIGDSGWVNACDAVAYVPGSNYQEIFASVGTVLYFTDDGGTNWNSVATLTFTPASIFATSSDKVIAYNKDAGGTNRVTIITGIQSTPSVAYLDTGHSTTGAGSTIIQIA